MIGLESVINFFYIIVKFILSTLGIIFKFQFMW